VAGGGGGGGGGNSAAPSPEVKRASAQQDQSLRTAQARVAELRFQGMRLLRYCFAADIHASPDVRARAIRSCVKWNPEMMVAHPSLVNNVVAVLRSPDRDQQLSVEERLPLRHRTLSRIACKCLMVCHVAGGPVAPLRELLSLAVVRSTCDVTFIADYFALAIARRASAEKRVAVLEQFADVLGERDKRLAVKEAAVRLVLIPVRVEAREVAAAAGADVFARERERRFWPACSRSG
jgi:hypothetical protein